jgi:hypothetical protein
MLGWLHEVALEVTQSIGCVSSGFRQDFNSVFGRQVEGQALEHSSSTIAILQR